MAKKYWSGDVTLNTEWAGDESTNNLPLSGGTVQKLIKDSINSKVGYVGRVDKIGQGFYVLCRDEETFNKYLETITDDLPLGNLQMDGVNGKFDAPFNYKMELTVTNPENGYKAVLLGSTNNQITIKGQTVDASNTSIGENLTITFKVTNESGVENSYTAIYDAKTAADGITYNLDGKLSSGQNTIIVTAVGMNSGVSAMRRITYRVIDMSFIDSFNILKRYRYNGNKLEIDVNYSLKGIGETTLIWYFDGVKFEEEEIKNHNPNLSNANKHFVFTGNRDKERMNAGKHNIQILMSCRDIEDNSEFKTPVYYREFIIDDNSYNFETPYILRKITLNDVLTTGSILTINNTKQYENTTIEYGVFYNGKSDCAVETGIMYIEENEYKELSKEKLPMVVDGFSELQKHSISLEKAGEAEIILKAFDIKNNVFEEKYYTDIKENDMIISTISYDDTALSLNAFGRSNNSSNKNEWVYSGVDGTITTTFSDNFDWSNTSGWADNKLKLNKGNSITINYKPFSDDKMDNLKNRGGTYEFEFETINVYNDDAVICKICGNDDNAPGIVIYASGAELVISRDKVTDNEDVNAGYMRAVSTKYKAEESNRISFVITPNKKINDDDGTAYRDRILKIYVNGELCGAYPYDENAVFSNDSTITFRGSEECCVNISSIQIYKRALTSDEILNNYIYFRNSGVEKSEIYKRNDITLESNTSIFDSDKLKSQLPIMTFYQIYDEQSLDDIHQEKKNKKLTRFFDVVYIDIQHPNKNFLIKNAYVTPQGTSSMNYPVKNLRLYTGKKDKAGNYYSRLFVGSNIFSGSSTNPSMDNINLETEVTGKRKYSFRDETRTQKAAAPVNCWCLKADFAESSSSHNTGTARYWNNVLKTNGFNTKAQIKSAQHTDLYNYDVRTCIDGFPIAVFYQPLKGNLRFEGKYNFNNDKSTEDVFGFTGGKEIPGQTVQYYYIGKEVPIVHGEENDKGEWEWACKVVSSGYTETPTVDSPLYASKFNDDGTEDWYMLRGKELLDNPKMECWEILNSVNELALFKTAQNFTTGDKDEKVGILDSKGEFHEAFESRYPDCGDYYHYNSLKRFAQWLVSCRYLTIDNNTGESIPFAETSLNPLPSENYYVSNGKLSIHLLNTKKTGEIRLNFPGKNFYKPIEYSNIQNNIKNDGYQKIKINVPSGETYEDIVASLSYIKVAELPNNKLDTYLYLFFNDEYYTWSNNSYEITNDVPSDIISTKNYIKVNELPSSEISVYEYLELDGYFYTWLLGNVLNTNKIPETHQTEYDYVLVNNNEYYVWDNTYNLEDFHIEQKVDDTAFNRALKFAVEKYDHIDMDKMAAYYIYLMRFGGVDQTVKNAMLTTEGPANDDPLSTLPSLWYFINYDNDTILGVKNDGRLVFDPYITRQTKDGTGYVYAGRESTLWNNLENDTEFMETVTKVDNILAKGEGNSLYALSYSNAIREYDINQSDKWCERIYNKDAERKYIDTFVKGWTQHNDEENTTSENVTEDYLYDVHGSRSSHRKWWLGRRFNIFDSRFCNDNFKNSFIKFRSTNLPAGATITIKSGEPIYYAWGHDNSVTEITKTAIQPGEYCTFTTMSAFNIGSYLELMGAPNIATLNLRGCVGALTEIDITGCKSPSIGTKLKEIYIGDNTRQDLVNISNTAMKFSGLKQASKLEYLDITNIKNITLLDGMDTLLNIKEVYAKGSSVSNFTFSEGCAIEKLHLPSTIETLSLTKSSNINYNNISFEGGGYGKLRNLTINNCPQLMNNPDFILNWLYSTPKEQRNKLSLNLQGINWVFNKCNSLLDLGEIGTRNIQGTIQINEKINVEIATKLQNIFGEKCFKEGSTVYIKTPTAIFLDVPSTLWEGDDVVRCNVITVGTTSTSSLETIIKVKTINGDELFIDDTNGVITVDETNLNNGYILFKINESEHEYKSLYINIKCTVNGFTYDTSITCNINKRIYPDSTTIYTVSDSFNNINENELSLIYAPQDINDLNLIGRGFFTVSWEIFTGTTDYNTKVLLSNKKGEKTYIKAPTGFDGKVIVKAIINRNFDNKQICETTKELEFTDPSTIVTELSNKPLYDILVKHNIITEIDGFGKLNKNDASQITINDLIDKETGKSIFANNKELESFIEFEWFGDASIGGLATPNGMFENCTKLKEIALSDNFKYSAKNMFNGCSNLECIYGASQGKTYPNSNELIYTSLSLTHVGDNFANGCKKLSTCKLSSLVNYIGATAFKNCESLTDFTIPSNSALEIVYGTNDTPFSGCKNINFTEGTQYDENSNDKYRIKNGACYKIIDEFTLDLIHMGKNTLISDIPTKKIDENGETGITVYAYAYSMEGRTEENIIIPENIIFNGHYIFYNSIGKSIKLNRYVDNKSPYLFANTNYNGNYIFHVNETTIPSYCFYNASGMASYTVPEGITTIENGAFYQCKMNEIILPTSLTTINTQAFWLTYLKDMTFLSENPPHISMETHDVFFSVMLDNIYVKPEYYDNYYGTGEKEGIHNLFKPFITPIHLHSTGYIRLYKDGELIYNDENNIIKVGNANITEKIDGGYMEYTYNGNDNNIDVLINNEVVGKISSKYTTIYIGDNSNLYIGDGLSFECGVPMSVENEINSKGWYYDARFKGIRSNPNSLEKDEITLSLPNYKNKIINIKYGKYAYESYVYVKNDEDENILNETLSTLNKFDIETETTGMLSESGNIKIGIDKTNSGSIKHGINGMVINKLGDAVYSDIELSNISLYSNNNENIKQVKVKLNSPIEITKNVFITLTDNKAFTYSKLWNGEILTFNLPINHDFIAIASDFVTNDGKYYYLTNPQKIENEEIEITYEYKTGIEIINNILCYYTNEQDWYIDLNRYTGTWSNSNIDIPENSVLDIEASDTDGVLNSINVNKYDKNSICNTALKHTFFDNIKGYIPSYIEMEIFSQYLPEINDFLKENNKEIISLDNCWVSETYDSENAWNTDGKYYNKNTIHNYYIFGKKR